MDTIGKELFTRALALTGSTDAWRLSWPNINLLVAYYLNGDDYDDWIFHATYKQMSYRAIRTASRETILLEPTKDVMHCSGIQYFINYCLRTRSWMDTGERAEHPHGSFQNLKRRNICHYKSQDYRRWLQATAGIKGFDGSDRLIPVRWLWKNPFLRKGKNYDDYDRPTKFSMEKKSFIKADGWADPLCACGNPLEHDLEIWPHPTERCNKCVQCVAIRMDGVLKLGNIETFDYARMATIAKEFASTIKWVRNNIKIVVPDEFFPTISEILGPGLTSKTYVVPGQ